METIKKFAIVTGASTGIGQAIAIALAKDNFFVLLVGRRLDTLTATKELISKAGGSSEVYECDLANTESLNRFIQMIKEKTDKVSVLVNVAGIWHGKDEVYAGKDFDTFSPEVITNTYAVGLLAPTLLAHACIPLMKHGGKILNISGTFENGAKGWLPYYVSKKGIEDLTVGLSEEVKDKNIQVNAISPSDTATDAYKKYFPQYIGDAIEPSEIGTYAAYICSTAADSITGKVFVMKKGQELTEGFHT